VDRVKPVSTPLNIAFISLHTSPADMPGSGDAGGMNVVERHQAFALAALGHRVELITRRSNRDIPEVVELADRVTLRQVVAGPQERLAKSLIDAHIPEFEAGLRALAPPDIVHSHHWMSGVAALPVARHWGIPHVQSFHSVAALPGSALSDGEPPESPARVPGERLVATESDAVIAISAAEARTVVERCGGDPARVSIVSPGVDGALFHARAGETIATPSRNPRGYLLYAARLQPLKGPDLAIGALAEVPTELRPDLLIAGDVSVDFAAYEAEVVRMVTRLGLQDYVHFVGPQQRESLAALMRGARIVLVPSHSETFGLIALESASCGTPVIASAAGGLREAVVHGETGQLMDSRQAEDWGTAITRLLAKPAVLERMGMVSQIHARRFNWELVARLLEDHYRALIGAL
jgi:D-inositol-3-phosphate glycosyltransferase